MTTVPANRPNEPIPWLLGSVLGSPHIQVQLPFDEIVHAVCFGQTNSGKSRLLQRIVEHCLRDVIDDILGVDAGDRPRRSICIIEPHGGLIDAVLGLISKYVPPEKFAAVLPHIHYLQLGNIDRQFAFDPTLFDPPQGIPEHRIPSKLTAHINRQSDVIAEMFVRQHAQALVDTPTLRRLLKRLIKIAMLAKCPFEFLEWILDPDDDLANDFVAELLHRLPRRLRSFLERLRKDLRGRDKRIADSTLNRLEAVLTEVGRMFFCRIDDPRTFDFKRHLSVPSIFLIDCRESDDASEEHGDVFGGLLLNRLLTTIKSFAPESIPRMYCFIDEASRYIGLDIDRNMLALRKWASLWLCTQDLSSLKRGELDLSRKILSQTNAAITFNQTDDEDLKVLVPRICRSNISFEEQFRIQQLHAGTIVIPYTKRSRTISESTSIGSRESELAGSTVTTGTRDGESTRLADISSVTRSTQSANNLANTSSRTLGSDISKSSGSSESESEEFLTLPKYETIRQPDGLKEQLNVQWEKLTQQIFELETAQIVAKLPGIKPAIPIQVVHIDLPFATQAFHDAMVNRLVASLSSTHDYFLLEPDLTEEAHEERLMQWIRDARAQRAADDDDSSPFLSGK